MKTTRIDDVLAAVNELAATVQSEALERRALWDICAEHPKRLGVVESDLLAVRIRLSVVEDTVRGLMRNKRST